jgi:hypothetical protein
VFALEALTLVTRIHDAVAQWIRREQTQLNFHGRERMYSMCPANGVCAHLAQAYTPDLALLDQLRQCSHRDFDGSSGIDSSQTFSLGGSEG